MNKRLFKSLLFREYYVARKFYGLNLLVYVMIVIVALLALLSYRWGNLHLYSHLMNEGIKTGVGNAIRYVPVFIASCFWGGALDSVPDDEKGNWNRFRIACPATPFQLALAKYCCLFLTWFISLGMLFGWLGLHGLLTGTVISRKDITIIFSIYTMFAILYVLIINLTIWLKDVNLAALIISIIFTIPGSFIMVYIMSMDPDLSQTKAFINGLLPFMPLIMLASLLIGIFCTTMLYGRREK